MRVRFVHRLGRLAAALGACLAAATVAAPSASATGPEFHHYVALGDSYTSGPLIPFQRLDPLGCFRSTSNYPALLAGKLQPDTFTDVSCGGADTTNMTAAQSVPLGSNAPQFDALQPDTDLVTLGIGGNDFSVFGTVVDTCTTLRDSDPTGAPCRDKLTVNGVDTLMARMPAIQQRVTAVLAGIHQRAPHATVLVVGYPHILPDSGYCPALFPAADGDYGWANQIEHGLNTAIANAVAADGHASYLDTYTPSASHDICATGGAAWINGQYTNLLAAFAYHPFRDAMVAEASLAYQALGGSSPAPATTSTVRSPVATQDQLRAAYDLTAGRIER